MIDSFKILLVCLFLVINTSCKHQQNNIQYSSIDSVYEKQELKIIPMYRQMDTFISALEKEPNNSTALYNKFIFKPIKEQFVKNSEFSDILESINQSSKNAQALKEEITALENSEIISQISLTFKNICKNLPGPNTTIVLLPMNPDMKGLYKKHNLGFMYTGVTAITPGSGILIISIDPLEKGWETILNFVLAHEYHHSVWMSKNFQRKDLSVIEYLVFEGRADAFAKTLYPDITVLWNSNLSKEKEKIVWDIIKNKLDSRDEKLNERIMVGDHIIPYSSGYCIGYNIVKKYMEQYPEENPQSLIDIEPMEVLRKSKYKEYITN